MGARGQWSMVNELISYGYHFSRVLSSFILLIHLLNYSTALAGINRLIVPNCSMGVENDFLGFRDVVLVVTPMKKHSDKFAKWSR